MVKASYLLNAVVGAIAGIPTVVALMGESGVEGIYAMPVIFPDSSSVRRAIHEMPHPGILVVYQDLLPQGRARPYAHRLRVFFRAYEAATEDFAHEVLTGAVDGQNGLDIRQYAIVPEVETMNPPGLTRATDEEGEDYFYSDFIFEEIGDS